MQLPPKGGIRLDQTRNYLICTKKKASLRALNMDSLYKAARSTMGQSTRPLA